MRKTLFLLMSVMLLFSLFKCKDEPGPIGEDSLVPPIVETKKTVNTTKVVTYEGPSILESSGLAKVWVNDTELFVYETNVNHGRVFTFSQQNIKKVPVVIFDFEGKVNVRVKLPGIQITSAKITPAAYNITPTIDGDTVSFDLEYPTGYTLEYNNQTTDVVHIFANPLEENTPDPANIPSDMIYIGPGVYKSDAIPVTSGKTVYLAGGAVVYGNIRASHVENVTIRGRGIISGDIYPRTKASEFTIPFEIRNSKNIKLEGITFLDSAGWTINAYFLDGFEINNIKIVTARANGDGISLQSCKNVLVKHSFVRSWDDALVVKNYDRGVTENIRFENITIWNDLAQSMEIGYEAYGDYIKNVVFNNITVLHNFHKPAMSIHNADDANVSDIIFNNITIEDAQMNGDNQKENYDDFLIELNILYNLEWTKSGQKRGTIDNVTFNNIVVKGGKADLNTKINGFDATHRVTNVKFNNIRYLDKDVKSASDLNATANEFTSGISYNFTKTPTGAEVYHAYNLDLKDAKVQMVNKPNVQQVGVMVPEFAIGELTKAYMGVKVTGNFTITATHGTSTPVWDDGSGDYSKEGYPVANLLNENNGLAWKAKPWTGTEGEYASINITFDEAKTIGTIRLYGDAESMFFLTQNIAVYGIRSSSTSGNFLKLTNSDNYNFTPSSGNFVDIKINPVELTAIQIRIYNKKSLASPTEAFLNQIEFYPASLSFGKAVSGTPHEDVYVINNLVDGIPTTYYEAKKGTLPAVITIDFGAAYNIKYINLFLPPLMQWEARTQIIDFLVSTDGVNFTEIIHQMSCRFDPLTGNVVEIILDNPVNCRYLRLNVVSNTSSGGESAQLSEISVYE